MKSNHLIPVLSLLIALLPFISTGAQPLNISENGRYLVREDGRPFFYLGDTAWELFHRLDAEEARRYLENRAAKGFTVIQAVVLAQIGGLTVPNANGDLPLEDKDPTKPVEAYFRHVDAIVDMAEERGLVIGMLPTWGSYWNSTNGRERIFTPESARSFGQFLGRRYREKPIIWILGGDENINNAEERAIVEAMAQGLEAGDEGRLLKTFHPRGPGRSSDYFHEADWLDFNMYQSSHGAHDHDNGLYAEHDYQLQPAKPTLDGEPRYELIPVGFYFDGANRLDLFDDYDCRQAAYWSVLAGAAGHTYGHSSIWQMWTPERQPVLGAVVPWYEAVDHPGSFQMKHLRTLFEARPFNKLVPRQSMILDGPPAGGAKIRAALAGDGSFAVIYSPRGMPFTVDQSLIRGARLKSIWYNPRYGIAHATHTGNTFAIQTYTPPTSGRGNDWVLILENGDLGWPLPGREGAK
jgi:hypothetical protein